MFWRSRFSRRAWRSAGVSGYLWKAAAGDGDADGAWMVTRAGHACGAAGGNGDTSAKGDGGVNATGTRRPEPEPAQARRRVPPSYFLLPAARRRAAATARRGLYQLPRCLEFGHGIKPPLEMTRAVSRLIRFVPQRDTSGADQSAQLIQ